MATQESTQGAVGEPKGLSGLEKASILLMALGANASAQVLKHLNELEIEKLSAEIVKAQQVDQGLTQSVLQEFESSYSTGRSRAAAKEFASKLLEQAVGADKANELMQKVARPGGSRGHRFEFLWQAEADRIALMLKQEQPQIVALVMVSLPREKAADVLSRFDEAAQGQIAVAICNLEDVDAEVLAGIEDGLHAKLSTATIQATASAGPKTLVEILNNAERSTERVILDALNKGQPQVGDQVRKMMFIFEDLLKLEDRSVQMVLREIDQEDLRLAMKGADDSIKELIFKNMSERAAETLKEDLELAGAVKVKDIEAAQQRIVSVVRRLLASSEIALAEAQEGTVA